MPKAESKELSMRRTERNGLYDLKWTGRTNVSDDVRAKRKRKG